MLSQADKLNTIIKAAGVADVEPIWATLFAKALEGKDVKDMLLNVGSGGGAAAAAPGGGGGGAAAGGAAAAEEAPKEEEKEEGKPVHTGIVHADRSRTATDVFGIHREGRVRRGHGLRSLRLNIRLTSNSFSCTISPPLRLLRAQTSAIRKQKIGVCVYRIASTRLWNSVRQRNESSRPP